MEDLHHSKKTEDNGVKTLKKSLLASMKQRFDCYEDNDVYILATFLDPRYRTWFFRKTSTVENVTECIKDRLYEELSNSANEANNTSSSSSNSEEKDGFAQRMHAIYKKNKLKSNPVGEDKILKKEIEMTVYDYCKESPAENAFNYWKERASSSNLVIQAMAKMAEIYLTPSPTTTDVERLFSTARDIITNERNRLLPATAEKLLFLREDFPKINFNY